MSVIDVHAFRLGAIWRLLVATLLLTTFVATALTASAQSESGTPEAPPPAVPVEPASDATLGYPGLTIIATDSGFVLPEGLAAGRYFMTTENAGTFWSHYFTLRVPDEITDAELAASMETEADPEWLFTADVVGNADQTLPGKETHAVVDLVAGRYILIDPIRGLTGSFTVNAATDTTAPADPDSDLDVEMTEMRFAGIGDTVPAGPTVWKVTNTGAVWHETVIIHVPEGTTDKSLLAGSEDTGPDDTFINSLVGGSAVISPGNTAWMVLDLEPGTYAAICTFPSDTGEVHAMEGMLKVFTVS